jgi:hypothetical protein
MLAAHSPHTVHLTLAFAIRLWAELGEKATPDMEAFGRLPNPYKPGLRHSEFVNFVQREPLLSEQDENEWRSRLGGLATTTSS